MRHVLKQIIIKSAPTAMILSSFFLLILAGSNISDALNVPKGQSPGGELLLAFLYLLFFFFSLIATVILSMLNYKQKIKDNLILKNELIIDIPRLYSFFKRTSFSFGFKNEDISTLLKNKDDLLIDVEHKIKVKLLNSENNEIKADVYPSRSKFHFVSIYIDNKKELKNVKKISIKTESDSVFELNLHFHSFDPK